MWGVGGLKKYALCSENKQCVICGAVLQLVRKTAKWYFETTNTSTDRPTNIYNCSNCRKDHVMIGFHIDDSGWDRLLLPILEVEPKAPPKPVANKSLVPTKILPKQTTKAQNDRRASKVTTYVDLKIVEEYKRQKAEEEAKQEAKKLQAQIKVQKPLEPFEAIETEQSIESNKPNEFHESNKHV